MDNCRFCDIINGKVKDYKVWEDKDFLLLLEISPHKPGHCMLIPKEHVGDVFNLGNEIYLKLFSTIKKLSEPLKKAMGAKRIGVAIVGFSMEHVHVHLVPLHKSGEMFENSKFSRASDWDLSFMENKLKKELEGI